MSVFKVYNGPAPTTAAQASVSTGTSIKTLLQLKAPASKGMIITGWGYSLDTAQAAVGTIELLKTDVAATVTAYASGDIVAVGTPSVTSAIQLGTSKSGYTGSAEGTITATSVYDARKFTNASSGDLVYVRAFESGQRPYIAPNGFLRVRVTAGTSSGCICWVTWQEK